MVGAQYLPASGGNCATLFLYWNSALSARGGQVARATI